MHKMRVHFDLNFHYRDILNCGWEWEEFPPRCFPTSARQDLPLATIDDQAPAAAPP